MARAVARPASLGARARRAMSMLALALITVVVVPVLVAGGVEIGFRAFSPWPGDWATYEQRDGYLYFHRPDSQGWETSPVNDFPPNLVQYDNHGLRGDANFPSVKPPGEKRVLLLGDSYLEDRETPLAETMAVGLQRRLTNAFGKEVRVLNAGLSGTASIPESIYLEREGMSLQPDAVVLFFTFNNYTNNAVHHWLDYPDYLESGLPDSLKPVEYGRGYVPVDPDLRRARDSAFYYWIYRQKLTQRTIAAEGDPVAYYMQTKTLDLNPKGVFNTQYTAAEQRVVDLTNASLGRLQRFLSARGTPLFVVAIPWPNQVGAREWNPGKAAFGFARDEVITSTRFPDVLLSYLGSQSIPHLDLLPSLKAAEPAQYPLYLGYEGHWTPAGNRVVANAVFDYLWRQPSFMASMS